MIIRRTLPACIFAILCATARADSPPPTDGLPTLDAIERTISGVIARVEPSVVAVSRFTPQAAPRDNGDIFNELRSSIQSTQDAPPIGAGVIIDRAGLVLTQYLVVHEGDQHTVITTDGRRWPATIKGADPRSGLAVLAINTEGIANPGSFAALPFGDADALRKGQFVVAIGNPFAIATDGQPTASWGTITNLARKAAPGTNLNDAPGLIGDFRTTVHHLGTLIQTDAKLGWNASGGALVNMRGELVGLTTTAATIAGHEQPAGYAIPINTVFRRIIDTLKEGREVEYGMLGVSFGMGQFSTTRGAVSRTVVQQVFPGSPAARGGLQQGDTVTHVNDRPVNDLDSVQLVVSLMPPGTTATIAYERQGRAAEAKVRLTKLAVPGTKIVTTRRPSWQGIEVDYATALEQNGLMQAIASGALDPEGCVLVSDVEKDSPAYKAGIRPGMFIKSVGSKRVSTPEEFRSSVRDLGDRLELELTKPLNGPPENPPAAPDNPDSTPNPR